MEILHDLSREIENIVHYNANRIFHSIPPVIDNGLFKGQIGASIFLSYYGKHFGKTEFIKKGIDLIVDSFHNVHKLDHSFANGTGGLIWAANHLSKNGFVSFKVDNEVNDLLHRNISLQKANCYYDLFSGLMGSAVSVLSIPNNQCLIDVIIRHLMENIYKNKNEDVIFNSIFSSEFRVIFCLPYGLAGFLVIIGEIYKTRCNAKEVLELIRTIYKYLCIFIENNQKSKCFYPLAIRHNGEKILRDNSWLYGDLGILYSLLYSAQLLGDKIMEKNIINSLKISLDIPITNIGIGLSYGYLSNMFISRIIYKKNQRFIFYAKIQSDFRCVY